MKRLVQQTDLAWALADAARPYLCAVEHNDVYAAIGAGETFTAIRQLFKSVAVKQIPLRANLVQRCTTWLDAYVGHEQERYLRRLIEDFVIPYRIQVPPTAGINRRPTRPKHGRLVVLARRSGTSIALQPTTVPRLAERSADGLAGSRHSPPTSSTESGCGAR